MTHATRQEIDALRARAEAGVAEAQLDLGFMYANGRGVPQDYEKAERWYRLAAEQGHTTAQNGLGFMYENGAGVPQDYVEAHKWYNLAAARGNDLANKVRDLLAEKMTPAQIAKAQRLAGEWRPKK